MNENQIKSLLAQDRKIQAIHFVLQQTEWRLKKAKDYVDALERTLFPRSANMGNVPDAPNKRMIDKTCQLIAQGRKLEAIQLLHHTTEMTLKEYKDHIDRLDAEKLMP